MNKKSEIKGLGKLIKGKSKRKWGKLPMSTFRLPKTLMSDFRAAFPGAPEQPVWRWSMPSMKPIPPWIAAEYGGRGPTPESWIRTLSAAPEAQYPPRWVPVK